MVTDLLFIVSFNSKSHKKHDDLVTVFHVSPFRPPPDTFRMADRKRLSLVRKGNIMKLYM